MWKGLSTLELRAGGFNATSWRWEPGVAGHTWFLGSGRAERTRTLYRLAGEVTRRLAKG